MVEAKASTAQNAKMDAQQQKQNGNTGAKKKKRGGKKVAGKRKATATTTGSNANPPSQQTVLNQTKLSMGRNRRRNNRAPPTASVSEEASSAPAGKITDVRNIFGLSSAFSQYRHFPGMLALHKLLTSTASQREAEYQKALEEEKAKETDTQSLDEAATTNNSDDTSAAAALTADSAESEAKEGSETGSGKKRLGKRLNHDDLDEEEKGRIRRLLDAEWTPSTNSKFELLTGKADRFTYYLYSRVDRACCEDLCGGFVAIYLNEERKTADLIGLLPLRKDVAVFCWDLASLVTQASFVLSFLAASGFPQQLVSQYSKALDSIMSYPDLSPTKLPNLQVLSERLSSLTYEAGKLVYEILNKSRPDLKNPPPEDAGADDQPSIDATAEVDQKPNDDKEAATSTEAADASAESDVADLPPYEWEDLDEGFSELFEHLVLCGLSYISHLRMSHAIKSMEHNTVYTKLSISQIRVRPDGVMLPPPTSKEFEKLLADRSPFSDVVMHKHLDNEHIVSPEILHDYIRSTSIKTMFDELDGAIQAYLAVVTANRGEDLPPIAASGDDGDANEVKADAQPPADAVSA